MAKVVQVKLYKMHDYDLYMYYLSLRHCKAKSFSALMKEILVNYVRGQNFSAPQIEKYTATKPAEPIRVRFTLDEEKEADVIAFLNTIQYRQKNGFLKSLFRQSIGLAGLQNYIRSKDEFLQEKFKKEKKISAARPMSNEEQEIKEETVEKHEKIQPEMEQTVFPGISNFMQDTIAEDNSPGAFDFFGEMARIMED